MFIELTDHLRCPADHPESFLVLIPDEMAARHVRTGRLGCPVCLREFAISNGVANLGEVAARDSAPTERASVDASAVAAFLGLQGPGGFLVLVGEAGGFVPDLESLLPGIHFVLVNTSPGLPVGSGSLVQAPMIPLRSRSMRGVVLGWDYAEQPFWQGEGARVTLPGLRVVGVGRAPAVPELEVLASAGGWWVASRTTLLA